MTLLGTLQVQNDNLQLAHWNLKAPDFIPLHNYLGENYDATSEHIDMVAELIRMHDLSFIIPVRDLQVKASVIKPTTPNKTVKREDVLAMAVNDVDNVLALVGEIFNMTAMVPDVNDYMALICADYKKRAWFLMQSK